MKVVSCLFALLLICAAQTAWGQRYPYPFYGGGYSHASTYEEGVARGLADVIRSSGAANLMHSEASKNYQDAYKKYLDNRLQATNTYFQMRQANKQYRQAERGQPVTQQQLIRYAKQKLPDRLSASDLDPLTGDLSWPLLLRSQQFDLDRQQMQALFSQRANQGYLEPQQYLQVRELSTKMLNDMKPLTRSYPGSVTIEARKFLESLSFEAGFQAG